MGLAAFRGWFGYLALLWRLGVLSWCWCLGYDELSKDLKPRNRVNLTFAFFRYNLQLAYRRPDQRRRDGKGEDSRPDP